MRDITLQLYSECKCCDQTIDVGELEVCEACYKMLLSEELFVIEGDSWDSVAIGDDNYFTCNICRIKYHPE